MSQDPKPAKRAPGRPRDAALTDRALSAARDILLAEGFGRLTIEAVSRRSGVSKPTLYRHWSNASELALSALMTGLPSVPGGEPATPERDLPEQIRLLVRAFSTTRGRQIAMALAAADPDSEFTKAFRNRVILSSREAGRNMIDAAVAAGRLSRPADIDVLLDMIYGPIFYRLLAGHAPLDEAFANGLAAAAIELLRAHARR